MESNFVELKPTELTENIFKLIGSDWMLITAGDPSDFNTMTASWGGVGVLWNKNVCWCVIRPQRYTFEFMEKAENFTLSFFGEEQRDAFMLCGSKSGRDIDKAASTGLTPIEGGVPGTTSFAQARLVLTCRKIYFQDLNPENFIDPDIAMNYPENDYHRMYIGEIVRCWNKP